ncbi:lipopolysaccharide biosynthesis protein [Fibrella aquatica]|uniref:lipopolysaccharide biosynthesis protein n=1 Tax=Fibrella aquatica TaxID=3242487 RepID=UPI003520D619
MTTKTDLTALPTPEPVQSTWMGKLLVFLFSGQAVTAGLSVLIGKITATYIVPDQLGLYNLLFAGMTFAQTLLITPIIQSFKSAVTDNNQEPVIPFYIRLFLIAFGITLLVALLAGSWSGAPVLLLLVWLTGIGQALYSLGSDWLIINSQTKKLTWIQLTYSFINLLVLVVLVIVLQSRTARSIFVVLLSTNLVLAGLSLWQSRHQLLAVDWQQIGKANTYLWHRYKQYALPIMGLACSSWLLNYADRFLLDYYMTTTDVGLYSAGYNLGARISLLCSPFMIILSSEVYRAKAANTPEQIAPALQRTLLLFWLTGGAAWLVYTLFYVPISTLLLDKQYKAGFAVGPWVALGYMFLCSLWLVDIRRYAYGNTTFIALHNMVGAGVNILLNILFIPRFGLMGAAYAACLGYVAQALAVYVLRVTSE